MQSPPGQGKHRLYGLHTPSSGCTPQLLGENTKHRGKACTKAFDMPFRAPPPAPGPRGTRELVECVLPDLHPPPGLPGTKSVILFTYEIIYHYFGVGHPAPWGIERAPALLELKGFHLMGEAPCPGKGRASPVGILHGGMPLRSFPTRANEGNRVHTGSCSSVWVVSR